MKEIIKNTEELAKIMSKMEKLVPGSKEWMKLSVKAASMMNK